ncbi:hypothetical protein IWQ62_000750 [Dispira parvispora]|uniref:Uncharacterized protein n=1 Tax=Dispira parvispora TaxID=1520584 RepID=A0A9W8AV84_9FUNG|nr:hypothetical protein IWQ62_000750 [Dispira parvispora]
MQIFRLTQVFTLGLLFMANWGQLAHGVRSSSFDSSGHYPNQVLSRRSPGPITKKMGSMIKAGKAASSKIGQKIQGAKTSAKTRVKAVVNSAKSTAEKTKNFVLEKSGNQKAATNTNGPARTDTKSSLNSFTKMHPAANGFR